MGPVPGQEASAGTPAPADVHELFGLLHELGDRPHAAAYDHAWQRDRAMWEVIAEATAAFRSGGHAAAPAATAPRWLAPQVRRVLSDAATRTSWSDPWPTIRELERLGAVPAADDDTYVLAAVGALGAGRDRDRATALREDPELRERVVWRMFEVEGGGEVSLTNVDKFSPPGQGWMDAFQQLVADGTLDRARVLQSCLDALGRDFSAYRVGWFGRLFDSLAPTTAEVAALQDRLRGLLRSPITATVSLSVRHLATLASAGGLDDEPAVPALAAAMHAPAKGAALAAVRLLDGIARRRPELSSAAGDAVRPGLEHPKAEVQRAAGALLLRLGAHATVAAHAALLEPSVRDDLGVVDPVPTTEPVLGHDARPPSAGRVRRLTADEVLDAYAALLEDASDPLLVEGALAALAATPDLGPSLRPLRKRAQTVLARGPGDYAPRGWLRGQLARLVLLATGVPTPGLDRPDAIAGFLVGRVDEVAAIVDGSRPPTTLLATPDSDDGWLLAETYVDRLLTAPHQPGPHDLVAALLRLHPDDRGAALSRLADANGLPAGLRAVSRHALGGDAADGGEPLPDAPSASWVAAGRSRCPLEADLLLTRLGLTGAGRAAPIEADVVLDEKHFTWTDARGEHPDSYWRWAVQVAHPAPVTPPLEPTATSGTDVEHRARAAEQYVGWDAWTYPHDAEHLLAHRAGPVLEAALFGEVQHDAARVLRALAAHPGRMGRLATATLAAGLAAAKVPDRVAAVDAVDALHAAGRLTSDGLGAGLAVIGRAVVLTRWAASLRDLAATSPANRALVTDALSAALPRLDPATTGVHALLSLLHEELLRAGRPAPSPLLPWLDRFTGSSNAARTARKLKSSIRP